MVLALAILLLLRLALHGSARRAFRCRGGVGVVRAWAPFEALRREAPSCAGERPLSVLSSLYASHNTTTTLFRHLRSPRNIWPIPPLRSTLLEIEGSTCDVMEPGAKRHRTTWRSCRVQDAGWLFGTPQFWFEVALLLAHLGDVRLCLLKPL